MFRARTFIAAALFLLWAGAPSAHEIPNDVTVQALLRPEGDRVRLLVRVPLIAMRDMDYPSPVRGSGLVDLSKADPTLRDAATLWVADEIELYEETTRLAYPRVAAVRASLPSDRSFVSYDDALAHVTGPRLPDTTQFLWTQGMLDMLLEYPIQSDRSRFSIRLKLDRLGIRTLTVLRFLPPGGGVRAFELLGDPGLVRLDPRWHQTAIHFARLGLLDLFDGVEYLLFLVCLAMPFRRFVPLAAVVTSFAAAHSITLIASGYNLAPDALWFPPLVETLIAASILYLALENVFVEAGDASPATVQLKRRWLITFAFGLVHGFGLSFALRPTLQFAGSHRLTSILSFNAGVELGLLLVLVVVVPALGWLFRYVVAERLGAIILSGLAAHTAWHWMIERYDLLRQFRFQWPAIDALFWVGAMRWAMLAVAGAALYWLVFNVLNVQRAPATPPGPRTEPASSRTSS